MTRPTGAEKAHRVLAVQATHHHEFIQNPSSFLSVARAVTPRQRNHQLVSCRHADLPHVRPHRCTPVGSKLDEATGRPLGAFQARQCGHHPDCRATATPPASVGRCWGHHGGNTGRCASPAPCKARRPACAHHIEGRRAPGPNSCSRSLHSWGSSSDLQSYPLPPHQFRLLADEVVQGEA